MKLTHIFFNDTCLKVNICEKTIRNRFNEKGFSYRKAKKNNNIVLDRLLVIIIDRLL